MNNRMKYKKNQGVSMIEVLIAMVILSIGLLGVAGLQVVAIQNNHSANLRTQASLLFAEYSNILRSNMVAVDANSFGTAAADNAEFDTASPGNNIASCYTSSGCNAMQLAQAERFRWAGEVVSQLPSGNATSNRIGDIYTVTITWLDDVANSSNTSITMSFQP